MSSHDIVLLHHISLLVIVTAVIHYACIVVLLDFCRHCINSMAVELTLSKHASLYCLQQIRSLSPCKLPMVVSFQSPSHVKLWMVQCYR